MEKNNVFKNIIIYAITLILFFVVAGVADRYDGSFVNVILLLVVGAFVGLFVSTLFHELGHLLGAKSKKFAFSSITIWFFKWYKKGKIIKFCFTIPLGEAGYTEVIPTKSENVGKDYSHVVKSGLICSLIPVVLGVIPLFLTMLPQWVYCMWVMCLPIGAYSFLDNAIPMIYEGERNDGCLLKMLKNDDDSAKVFVNLLKIQAEIFNGKTPSEIDEDYYFNLPQLREDDLLFARLLNARYNYYLDKGDYENAKNVTERLLSLEEYLPSHYMTEIKSDALYNACTFDFNEEKADDLTYELEKYLNKVNTPTTIRIKLSYILFVKGERDMFEPFYNKGVKMASKCQIKGLGRFETKLLDDIKSKFYNK